MNHDSLKIKLFDYSQDIMCAFDFAGNFVMSNDAFTKLLGWLPNEVNGKSFFDLVQAEDREIAVKGFASLRKGQQTFRVENRCINKAGNHCLLAWKIYADVADELVFGVAYDVTEMRQLEKAKDYQDELYRLVLEGSNDGIWDWDINGKRVYFSPRCREMLGYTVQELPDDLFYWQNIVHEYDKKRVVDYMAAFLNGEIKTFSLSCRYKHKNGSYRWILSRAAISRDELGRPIRMAGSHTDITGRKQDEESLLILNKRLEEEEKKARQANEVKSQFLGTVSHELRTPLNAIFGMNYQLSSSMLDDLQRECVDEIEIAAKRLLALIDDIMLYSQFNDCKQTNKNVLLSIPAMAASVNDRFQRLAKNRELDFVIAIADEVEEYYYCADDLLIERLLGFLFDNAIKFTISGYVHMDVWIIKNEGNKSTLRFQISDSGIGIADEQREKIFELFSQADNSVTRKFGGVGMGLALAQKIAAVLDSQLKVNSEIGKGTQFYFDLVLHKFNDY